MWAALLNLDLVFLNNNFHGNTAPSKVKSQKEKKKYKKRILKMT